MTITEEHTLVRRLLQRLGSPYRYTENVLAGEYCHQPVKIVTGGVRRLTPAGPVGAPDAGRSNRPSALEFALSGANVADSAASPPKVEPPPPAPEAAPPRLPDPAPEPSPAEVFALALEAKGHRILTRNGKLYFSNASLLTADDEVNIKLYWPELLARAEYWPEPQKTSLAVFLGNAPAPSLAADWVAQDPPENLPHDIILNFETNGLDWAHGDEPIGVTIGTFDGLRRYLPFAHRGGGNLDRAVVIRYLQSLRGHHITNANTRFDVHMGHNIGVDFEAQDCTVSDVMHWAALLDDHRRRFALDVLAKDYLGGSEVERVDERNMADYAAADVARRAEYQVQLVAELKEKMWPLLDAEDLQRVRQLEDETIYPVVEMEKNGSLLDLELLEKYHAECTKRHDDLIWEVSRECGFGFEHTASGWQKLLEHLGLRVPNSFAENVLNGYDHPLVKKAQLASQYASLNSKTFAAYKKNVGSDGILRYDINQLRGDDGGTVSGRFSIGYVQQVPNHDNHAATFGEDLYPRRLFIAGKGDYLQSDARQIEYRLFAHFAENQEVLKAYNEDPLTSFHKKTWEMFKRYKPEMLYSHVKNANFAKMYGAKLVKLAIMMGFITEAEGAEIKSRKAWNDPRLVLAKEIDGIYKQAMPEVDQLLDKASHLAKFECDNYCKRNDSLHRQFKHRGYVKTLEGRRSRFPDNFKTYIALNRVLQGTAADIMKRKLVELHKARAWTGFLMRLTVHDAVGGDAQIPETKARVEEVLNAQSFALKVKILWETGVGKSWADAK